jgi:hypothetical protein
VSLSDTKPKNEPRLNKEMLCHDGDSDDILSFADSSITQTQSVLPSNNLSAAGGSACKAKQIEYDEELNFSLKKKVDRVYSKSKGELMQPDDEIEYIDTIETNRTNNTQQEYHPLPPTHPITHHKLNDQTHPHPFTISHSRPNPAPELSKYGIFTSI